jgi:hypothetical protein
MKNINKIKKTIRIMKEVCLKSNINYENFVKRTKCQIYGLKIYK